MKMKKGFTLIELMVVIVIMGILAAVAVPKIFGNVDKAKLSGVGETLSQFEQAVTNYYILNSGLANDNTLYDFTIEAQAPLSYDLSTPEQLTIDIANMGNCSEVSTVVAISGNTLQATRTVNHADCLTKLTKSRATVAGNTFTLVD